MVMIAGISEPKFASTADTSMLLELFGRPFFRADLLNALDIQKCLGMVPDAILIKVLQNVAGEILTFATIEQAFIHSTHPCRTIIDEVLFEATSHAIHILIVIETSATKDTAIGKCVIGVHAIVSYFLRVYSISILLNSLPSGPIIIISKRCEFLSLMVMS